MALHRYSVEELDGKLTLTFSSWESALDWIMADVRGNPKREREPVRKQLWFSGFYQFDENTLVVVRD